MRSAASLKHLRFWTTHYAIGLSPAFEVYSFFVEPDITTTRECALAMNPRPYVGRFPARCRARRRRLLQGLARILAGVSIACAARPQVCLARARGAQVPWGVRAMGLGGAFTALADDASSTFWNPAGLAGIDHQELAASDVRLYDTPLSSRVLSAALPVSSKSALGASWHRLGLDDAGLQYSLDQLSLGYAYRWAPQLQVGVTTKYVRQSTSFDDALVDAGSGGGYGFDAGVQSRLANGLRFGLAMQDVFDTKIHTSGATDDVLLTRTLRWAAGYDFRSRATVAFDLDDRWHLGAEVRPEDHVDLRAGLQGSAAESDGLTYSTGFGLRLGPLQLNYAYVMPPVLAPTHYWSLVASFRFNPALVEILKVESEELYASLYKSYALSDSAGGVGGPVTVTLRNTSDHTLNATVRVEIRGTSAGPSETAVVLPRGRAVHVPLALRLSERVLSAPSNQHVPVRVEVTYSSLRIPRTETRTANTFLFGPGAITWSRGVDQAAAFVTTDDPAVAELAKQFAVAAPAATLREFGHVNVGQAAAMFNALALLGVRYVRDPANPFEQMARDGHNDTLKYPRATLSERGGDCDDTTILCAALLGALGIRTALVDTPGHLSLLMDSGLRTQQRAALGVSPPLLVVRGDEIWIPIETTTVGSSFTAAWEEGARNFERHERERDALVVDVGAAWRKYPPATPPNSAPRLPALDEELLKARIDSDLVTLNAWRDRGRN